MVHNYIEKTYVGWLGKVIGIRMGAPIEGYSKEKIEQLYGKHITDYLVDYNDFACDDDSNGPIFFVRTLEHYDQVSPKEMGYTFLNYIANEHGFFWWGNELSTEHTAYKNLLKGIEAPESGSIAVNGQELAEQIGGQIFIDGFGFLAPGNPRVASDLAEHSARVTHDLEGVYGGRFIAACISLAYTHTDIIKIIKEALKEIPEDSTYKEVVERMLLCKEEGCSLEEAFLVLKNEYWSDRYKGVCHMIPNGGIIALSLIYGGGDFFKTMELVNLCGFDTDCNAGNVGAIMGVLTGIQSDENPRGIPKRFITPIKDIMLASSVVGSLNISTLSENTLLFCKLGYKIAGEDMPAMFKEYERKLSQEQTRISHFEFMDALHGFRIKGDYKNSEAFLQNTDEVAFEGKRSLKIMINNLHPNDTVSVYQKSYYEPKDLHDARYEPTFSPIVYPGDEVKGYLYLKTDQKLKAKLYCYDAGNDKTLQFGEVLLDSPGWKEIKGRIPSALNGLIKEVGIQIVSLNQDDTFFGEQVVVYLDELTIKANPSYSMVMADIPVDDYSLHSVVQKEVQGFTKYNKHLNNIKWQEDGILLTGEEHILTGDYYWRNYTCRLTFALYEGAGDLFIRNQGNLRSYFVRMEKDGIKVGSIFERKEEILLTVPYSIEYKKEYSLDVTVQDNVISLEIEGNRFSCKDPKERYLHGGIGMKAALNSSIRFIQYGIQGVNL